MSLGNHTMLQRIAEALERLVALKEQEAKRAIEQGLRPRPLFPYWDDHQQPMPSPFTCGTKTMDGFTTFIVGGTTLASRDANGKFTYNGNTKQENT